MVNLGKPAGRYRKNPAKQASLNVEYIGTIIAEFFNARHIRIVIAKI